MGVLPMRGVRESQQKKKQKKNHKNKTRKSQKDAIVLYCIVFEFYSGKCSANIQLDNLHQEQFKATPEKATKG